MTFDEFLLSNEYNKYDFDYDNRGSKNIIKIKYNDNIDFLYHPYYGSFEYDHKLEFIGLFEKNSRKLYGNSFYFAGKYSKELYSSLYESSVDAIFDKVMNGANILLKNYIEEHKNILMMNTKDLFNKFISFEENYNAIKKSSINDYIYEHESDIEFSVHSYRLDSERKNIVMKYLQNESETIEKVYSEYINNNEKTEALRWYENNEVYRDVYAKDYIGVRLHQQELYEKLKKELEQNPNNEYKKKHDIIKSMKNLDAQMVTITIKHNENIITFKYPKKEIDNLNYSEWNIPDLKIRSKMRELYKGYGYNTDSLFLNEIIKIEYSRKIIYEDQNILNKQNVEQEMNEFDYDI